MLGSRGRIDGGEAGAKFRATVTAFIMAIMINNRNWHALASTIQLFDFPPRHGELGACDVVFMRGLSPVFNTICCAAENSHNISA